MTVKERLQQIVGEMSEEEATQALALVEAARAGKPLVDIYGTPLGEVLAGVDPEVLRVSGPPTIEIPAGLPDIE